MTIHHGMSKGNELCEELGGLVKLRATPTELLRLCVEFTKPPPFQNKHVRAWDLPSSQMGVSVDGLSGEYFVSVSNEIHVLSSTGDWLRKWQLNDAPLNSFEIKFPHAVCVGGGIVYVSNRSDDRIHMYTPQGLLIRRWEIHGRVDGIAVHRGEVFVCDIGSHSIKVYDATDGTLRRSFGTKGTGDGQFLNPSGVLVTSLGEVWVADWSNYRLQAFDSQGLFLRIVQTGMFHPWHLVERGDQILASCSHRVLAFTLQGILTGDSTRSHKQVIHGMSVDRDGCLVITEGNQVVILD